MNDVKALSKVGYYVEVLGYYKKNVNWEVVDNHVVQEVKEHDQIVLQVFGFNLFG